ncbi:hypothetical protein IAG41_07560 [Sphingomonas sp. JC676]|uniref:hypothetical protein n=1 Tax=Sphingomonas sp. JC676 TaxID=2768065 RepID=UPI001657FBFE|nr:hypothetical protein [Sphingomonas sp. JC676]MBC9032243.1 hypothetical protein [Sphingomonas sp. JC676]
MMMLLGLAALAAVPARAQSGTDLLSAETVTVLGDARIVGADGARSWIGGGEGKSRFDAHDPDGDFHVRPWLAEADLVWQPRFTWSLSGTVVVTAQHGQEHPIDVSQAALAFKPILHGPAKLAVRAGLYWPDISLEHSGPEWRVTDTITPSAINSWIGDEIKTGGIEATLIMPLGTHRVAATLGAFGLNDTAGTLLAFRGWALHDQKATAFGRQPLPPLNAFMSSRQAPETRPVGEIDNRVGWYGKLGWSPSRAFELQFFHYDNRADPQAVTDGSQWGWRTHFNNVGAIVSVEQVTLKAQAMGGRTEMGYSRAGRIWADTSFRSAFLLATLGLNKGSVSARLDAFGTRGRGSILDNSYSEDGWAITAAARHELGPHLSLLAEVLHVDSIKQDRVRLGLPARQRQNQIQLALRVHI